MRVSGLLLRFLVLSIVHLPRKSSQRHSLCVKFCEDTAEDEKLYDMEIMVPCVGVEDDKCATSTGFCAKQCKGECVLGYLPCPRVAAPSPPPPPPPNTPPPPPPTTDPACLKYCQDTKFLHKLNPFHPYLYKIKCEKPPPARPPAGECGSLCPGCPGRPGNPSCAYGGVVSCPALDETLFPAICRQRCAEEAWRINRKKTDGRFNAYCGKLGASAQENDCGEECPAECRGWCSRNDMGGMLRCPAVDPKEPVTTTTTTSIIKTTPNGNKPENTPGPETPTGSENPPGPGEVKEKNNLLIYVAIAGVAVVVLLGLCVLGIIWFLKRRRAAAVAPDPSLPPDFPSTSSVEQQPQNHARFEGPPSNLVTEEPPSSETMEQEQQKRKKRKSKKRKSKRKSRAAQDLVNPAPINEGWETEGENLP